MQLFDDVGRDNHRSKRESEPVFEYYNFSARPAVAALRDLLENWFLRYPQVGGADLRARFRSPIDAQHQGAFFELYLHELLRSMAFEVMLHPELDNTSSSRPDFVVSRDGERLFYLEATLASPPQDLAAKERMVAQVYDTLNRMHSPNFFVAIRLDGLPETPPPGKRLSKDLEQWLTTLDPDELGNTLEDKGLDCLPSFEWSYEDWHISVLPIPKSSALRNSAGVRPIGITLPEAKWVDSHSQIRRAVSGKATKYGILALPYIVAVNVIDELADDIDIMNALFGQEVVTVYERPNAESRLEFGRQPNGAWLGPRGPQSTRVSAALIVTNLNAWTIAFKTPILIHNPWASNPLKPDVWSLTQQLANRATNQMQERPGRNASEFLSLPPEWPLRDDSHGVSD